MNDAIAKALILMGVGMTTVFAFLGILVGVMNLLAKVLPRLSFILPDPEPPKPKSRPPAASSDAEVALAIAAALRRAGTV